MPHWLLWQAEATRNIMDDRYKVIFENAAVGIARVDRNGRFQEVNQRLCEILGYDHYELMMKTFADITHPDDLDSDVRALERLLAGEIQVYRREKRYICKDGSIMWANLTVSMVREPDGTPDCFVSIIEDISARKWAEQKLRLAEEALRTSHARFRLLADTAPVMIWSAGIDKLCNFFNKSWLEFTGRPLEKELGNGWTEGIHPEDYDRCVHTYIKAFDARQPFKMEYRLRRYDGAYRYLLDHGAPQFSPSRKFIGYIGSCIDITDRKEAEAEREQLAKEQAARAAAEASIRSKDELLAMVSHELRSPLSAILSYARLLQPGPVSVENINKVVAVIERNAKAQLQIIEDLLDSARIMAGKLRVTPVPVDLAPVLDSALDTVRTSAEAKSISLVGQFSGRTEQVIGDPTRLGQIVWNLLSNAVKFTSEGGRVELMLESDADWVRIMVRDTGKGIEPEFLPYVFERFRQEDASSGRRHGGLGLGLSIVKYLVELHGGTIAAASAGPGRGSTFTVTLPRRYPEFLLNAG